MTEKLKPCPFCGGTPELIDNNPCAVIIYVRCPKCKAMIVREPENAEDTADKDAKQAVIEAWNTRKLTPTQEHADELYEGLTTVLDIVGDVCEAISKMFNSLTFDDAKDKFKHWAILLDDIARKNKEG